MSNVVMRFGRPVDTSTASTASMASFNSTGSAMELDRDVYKQSYGKSKAKEVEQKPARGVAKVANFFGRKFQRGKNNNKLGESPITQEYHAHKILVDDAKNADLVSLSNNHQSSATETTPKQPTTTISAKKQAASKRACSDVITSVSHDYTDYSNISDDEALKDVVERKNTGGVVTPFPEKLHELLCSEDLDESIISWSCHGRCFIIHTPKEFAASIMPQTFKHTKITSFQRQLNLYGFKRITKGKDRGAYYHEAFLRARPKLCELMRRMKIKGTGHKPLPDPDNEPDFYTMVDMSGKLPEPVVEVPQQNNAVRETSIGSFSRSLNPEPIPTNFNAMMLARETVCEQYHPQRFQMDASGGHFQQINENCFQQDVEPTRVVLGSTNYGQYPQNFQVQPVRGHFQTYEEGEGLHQFHVVPSGFNMNQLSQQTMFSERRLSEKQPSEGTRDSFCSFISKNARSDLDEMSLDISGAIEQQSCSCGSLDMDLENNSLRRGSSTRSIDDIQMQLVVNSVLAHHHGVATAEESYSLRSMASGGSLSKGALRALSSRSISSAATKSTFSSFKGNSAQIAGTPTISAAASDAQSETWAGEEDRIQAVDATIDFDRLFDTADVPLGMM